MIKSKQDLREYLNYEKKLYLFHNKRDNIFNFIQCGRNYVIWKYIKILRKTEYFYNKKNSICRNIMCSIYRRRKNKLGMKLGIEIGENCFKKGLLIYHSGNIVINSKARIGENCKLHGDNCIGNNGKEEEVPVIGNNVEIGVGAKILGGITLTDNIKIGANAVVVKDCNNLGKTLVGIPAKEI